MVGKEFKRSLAVFPIGTVMKLTELTARQIRYYEEHDLIRPKRSETNRRLYSLNDVDRLLEIMDFLSEGMTIKGIRMKYGLDQAEAEIKSLTDEDVRRILRDELDFQSHFD